MAFLPPTADIPNAAQLQNIQLANTVFYFDAQVRRTVHNLGAQFASSAAAEILLNDLNKGRRLLSTIVQQLFGTQRKIAAVRFVLLATFSSTRVQSPCKRPSTLFC